MWVSDVSVANDSSAWGRGCANGTASTDVALMAAKDSCMSADHTRTFKLPFSASVGKRLQCAGHRRQEPAVEVNHTQEVLELLGCGWARY